MFKNIKENNNNQWTIVNFSGGIEINKKRNSRSEKFGILKKKKITVLPL